MLPGFLDALRARGYHVVHMVPGHGDAIAFGQERRRMTQIAYAEGER